MKANKCKNKLCGYHYDPETDEYIDSCLWDGEKNCFLRKKYNRIYRAAEGYDFENSKQLLIGEKFLEEINNEEG